MWYYGLLEGRRSWIERTLVAGLRWCMLHRLGMSTLIISCWRLKWISMATGKGLTPLTLAASCGNKNPAYFLMQVRCTSLNQILFWFVTQMNLKFRLNVSVMGGGVVHYGKISPKNKVLSWSWRTQGWTALLHCTSRWLSSCWPRMPKWVSSVNEYNHNNLCPTTQSWGV